MAHIGVCRLGDTASGYCSGHSGTIAMTGTITTASSNVEGNDIGIATTGDIVTGSCGHTGVITGTGSAYVNNKHIARIGDSFSGTFYGTLTSGSSDVLCNS